MLAKEKGENMENQSYTEYEMGAIEKAFSFNYHTAEQEKEDNAAYCDIGDVARVLNITKKQATGVCVSLCNKGLVFPYEVNGDPIYMISDFGIDEYYRLFGSK